MDSERCPDGSGAKPILIRTDHRPELTAARVVASGGRGWGSASHFALLDRDLFEIVRELTQFL
jgi:hypothetical protein